MIYGFVDELVEVRYLEGDREKICKGKLKVHNDDFVRIDKGTTTVILNVANIIGITKSK